MTYLACWLIAGTVLVTVLVLAWREAGETDRQQAALDAVNDWYSRNE